MVPGASEMPGNCFRKDFGTQSYANERIPALTCGLIGINKKYYRPTEVEELLGNASKAKNELGWESKTSFQELVKCMVHADWEKVKKRGY